MERFREAERVLGDLGWTAWVFEYDGGPCTTEIRVLHRPAGKGQTEEVVHRAFGDDAVLGFRRIGSADEMDGSADDDVEYGGRAVLVVPPFGGNGSMIHGLTLNDARSVQSMPTRRFLPDAVVSHEGRVSSTEVALPGSTLRPGESKVLVDHSVLLGPVNGDVPEEEWARVRFELTLTALSNGRLPEREPTADSD